MKRKIITIIFVVFFTFVGLPLESFASASSKMTIKELIVQYSKEMGLDPALALCIANAESGFSQNKVSRGGAIGVFQLMPNTAKRIGVNPYKMKDNIKGGIKYYKMMYQMFGTTELALAAYNAGPGNVKKYKGIPPFRETQKFVSSIMKNYSVLKNHPDPVIAQIGGSIKDISYKKTKKVDTVDTNVDNEVNVVFKYPYENEIKEYLENQAI